MKQIAVSYKALLLIIILLAFSVALLSATDVADAFLTVPRDPVTVKPLATLTPTPTWTPGWWQHTTPTP